MSNPREQSFTKALFHGVIAADIVSPFPSISAEERDAVALLASDLRTLASTSIDSAAIDAMAKIPAELRAEIARRGLYGLTIPQTHGGRGLSFGAAARVLEEFGAIDASIAISVASHNCMGAWAIDRYGNEDQRRRLLPDIASGSRLVGFAMTERNAGSDGSSIEMSAELAEDGAGYVLSGEKIWITNGVYAETFIVFARTSAEKGHPRITAFVVEAGPGVEIRPSKAIIGARGIGAADVRFDRVRVPFRNILGEVGHGYALGLQVLNWGRLGLASAAIGGSRALLVTATTRATTRRAFRQPIAEFGLTKDKIARMTVETYAAQSLVRLTTGLMDAKVEDVILESSICKIVASETYAAHADFAARLGAGAAFEIGHPFERATRDARAHLILAGTNEILLAFTALAGLQSPSAKLAGVGLSIRDPIKGLGVLTDFAVRRARTTFGRERLDFAHAAIRSEAVMFEESVLGLARETERVLRKHGAAIATRQFVQRRLAEVTIDLLTLAAVLARTTLAIERHGESGAAREIELTVGIGRLLGPRLRDRLNEMERETDELLKAIAARTYDVGGLLDSDNER